MSKPFSFRRVIFLFFSNFVILLMSVLVIEFIFGNWRGTRGMQRLNVPHDIAIEVDISDVYPSKSGKILYKRDAYGLRGSFKNISRIRLLTVGGSTTNQSDIGEGETWQDVLSKNFEENGKQIGIANAGVDGQSILANARSLHTWLRHIPSLKPEFVLAYIGINDVCMGEKMYAPYFEDESSLRHLVATRSALYYLLRTLRGVIFRHQKTHWQFTPEDNKVTTVPLLKNDGLNLFGSPLAAYEKRLERLLLRIREMNATPIFVTQMLYPSRDSQGNVVASSEESSCWGQKINGVDRYHVLDLINQTTLDVCKKENLICFDLAHELKNFEPTDFIDDFEHNTPSGSKKIGDYLYSKMESLL